MEPLSTQGYRGTRDLYPEDMVLRGFLVEKIRETLHAFCYQEYDGPLLEPLELYAAKSSEEIVAEQLYHLTDRGERRLAIRPEMTPTLARMIASRSSQLVKPLRWYSLPTCMRFERPQRGRLREFLQLNVDALGGNPADEDVEIIQVAMGLLTALGARGGDFTVRVNHRGVMNALFQEVFKIDDAKTNSIMRLIDKKSKISPQEFAEGCQAAGLTPPDIARLEDLLGPQGWEQISTLLPPEKCACVNELGQTLDLLKKMVPAECVVFAPEIMRGFDYYTGLIFEIFDTHPDNRRALMGGGRYDNLVGSFGVPPLSGIGFGVSDVSLLNFLGVRQLLPQPVAAVDVAVIRFSDADRMHAFLLADLLRKSKMRVQSYVGSGKFGKQISVAEKQGARVVAFRGGDELAQNTFCVKFLASGTQKFYEMSEKGVEMLKADMDFKS